MGSFRNDPPNGRHNTPPARITEKAHVDWTRLKAALKGQKAFSLHDTTIRIKTPYDPAIRDLMRSLRGSWDQTLRCWKVHVSKSDQLYPHVDRIEQAFQDDLDDRVNAEARELEKDRRIWVDATRIGDYAEGAITFYDGREWWITHVGRAREFDGKIRHSVFLASADGTPLDLKEDDDFSGQL